MAQLKKKVLKKCMFCLKDHRGKTPKLCRARARVMKDLLKTHTLSLAMRKIESGQIDLDWAAQKYLKRMRD